MQQPDKLISQLKQRNELAFSRIYGMYSEAVFGIINSVLRDEALSEEVLQDVFVKIWERSDSYDPEKGRFFTWILNIARNSAIDKTRSRAFKNSRRNLNEDNFVDILGSTDHLNSKTDAIGIRSFIDKLKPACARIIDLLFFKGYTHKEAAETMEIPLGTLKTRNRSCMNDLRKIVLGT